MAEPIPLCSGCCLVEGGATTVAAQPGWAIGHCSQASHAGQGTAQGGASEGDGRWAGVLSSDCQTLPMRNVNT